MIVFCFVKQIVKNAKILLIFSSYMRLHWVRKSMWINLHSFLVTIPWMIEDVKCWICWVLCKIPDIKNTLAYPQSLTSQKLKYLLKSKRGWRKKYPGGRRKCYQWVAERSLLKLLLKQFQHTQWVVSRSQRVFVMRLKQWWESFGGVKGVKNKKLLSLVGRKCVSPSWMEEWGSKIYRLSTMLC